MDLSQVAQLFGQLPMQFASAVAITSGLVQVVKTIDVNSRYNRFLPLFAEIIGIGVGMGMHFGWVYSVLIGLVAIGVFRGAKVTVTGA